MGILELPSVLDGLSKLSGVRDVFAVIEVVADMGLLSVFWSFPTRSARFSRSPRRRRALWSRCSRCWTRCCRGTAAIQRTTNQRVSMYSH